MMQRGARPVQDVRPGTAAHEIRYQQPKSSTRSRNQRRVSEIRSEKPKSDSSSTARDRLYASSVPDSP
eukprot:479763-Rhodomonas_salina.1